jgi:methylglutaconyl-CoA hydratase
MMKNLKVIEDRHVLKITLSRPDVRNAFSPEMIHEITEVFVQASKREDLRAVYLHGDGKVFCAGADLNYMKDMAQFSFEKNQADAHKLHEMFEAVYACTFPVVTHVHGAAFGGALGLIAASDIVIGEEKTQYCFSEVKLGLAPAVISDFVLRKTGLGQVAPWMLTGQVFSTADAVRMGLVHFSADLVGSADLAEKTLQSFREAGPVAVCETKKLIHKLPQLSRTEAKAATSELIAHLRVSDEGQEGLKAFLQKRKAGWSLS